MKLTKEIMQRGAERREALRNKRLEEIKRRIEKVLVRIQRINKEA